MTTPLIVIPGYLSHDIHLQQMHDCLRSVRETARQTVDILIVDDKGPHPASRSFYQDMSNRYDVEVICKSENSGFSRTVNVGLKRAHAEGRVAILMNQDIEFISHGWLQAGLSDPADVVGAKLVFPTMLVQHAGIGFSLLHQHFDHLFRFAPVNLPEASVRSEVMVTGALQFIKPHVFDRIEYYDEDYRLSYEDVDWCLRVFLAGMKCAMNPDVLALHHEGMVRMRAQTPKMKAWMDHSHALLAKKHQNVNFAHFAFPIDRP